MIGRGQDPENLGARPESMAAEWPDNFPGPKDGAA